MVAYALAGTVDINLNQDPIGQDSAGNDVFLRDIWPTNAEIQQLMERCVTREQFETRYAHVDLGPEMWQAVSVEESQVYSWSEASTYVQEPPFFVGLSRDVDPIRAINEAKCLVKVGNSVTTDHISPWCDRSGWPCSSLLDGCGRITQCIQQFWLRRGNDRVMTRGTFANIRLRNELAPGTEGGWTTYYGAEGHGVEPGEVTSIYDASVAQGERNAAGRSGRY